MVRTDGFSSYEELESQGYRHEAQGIGERKSRSLKWLGYVHQVVGLMKRWVLGTHPGAVRRKHFWVYLEEFTFRFNRRGSRRRTWLFERLVGWGMQHRADPYWKIIERRRHSDRRCFSEP